jgi:hypothetical protein
MLTGLARPLAGGRRPGGRAGPFGVFLFRQFTRPRECELISGGRQRVRVTPGRYSFGLGCHACHTAYFRVTR